MLKAARLGKMSLTAKGLGKLDVNLTKPERIAAAALGATAYAPVLGSKAPDLIKKAGKSIDEAERASGQRSANATADQKGYDSIKINDNGSITAKVTPIGMRIEQRTTCDDKGCK